MSHDKQRWHWVIQWLWAMLRGQLMTCLSDINLSTTHIVLTSLVSLCLYFLCANAMCSKTAARHFDVRSLTWPPKSPDLKPIDHMWDSLENRIRNRPVQPRTRQNKMHCMKMDALPTIQDSTLHIINEETLPSMHHRQGRPFEILNCKFDKK